MDQKFEQELPKSTFEILEAYGGSLKDVGERSRSGFYLMGDNRDASVDSREFGEVPESSIRCKVVAVLATERSDGYSLGRMHIVR